jgi:hypothetical protein
MDEGFLAKMDFDHTTCQSRKADNLSFDKCCGAHLLIRVEQHNAIDAMEKGHLGADDLVHRASTVLWLARFGCGDES